MNNNTSNIYKNARIKAGLKREPVAEELHIDVRTLDKYEALNGRAPDDIVRQMCVLYNNRFLAFQHLKGGQLGEFLPDIQNTDFKGATLSMLSDFDEVDSIIMQIVKIASDGKVNEHERDSWERSKEQITELINSLYEVLLSDK